MKSTGIVRKSDLLGRVCLPIQARRALGIEPEDHVEVFIDGDSVVLRKHQSACVFCGSADDLQMHNGKAICPSCLQGLAQFAQGKGK